MKSTQEATAIEPTAIPTRGPVCSFLSSWSIGVSRTVGALTGPWGWFGWSRGFFGGVRAGSGEAGILTNEFPPTLWYNCTKHQHNIQMISIKKREVKHIGAYIKFGIELNSCGIMPLKLLFAIFLFKGSSQYIISSQIKCYEGKISSHIDMWEVTYSVARLRLLRTSTVPDSWLFCM